MRKNNVVALTSRISEKAHRLIIRELENNGIHGIVPSHGSILAMLFSGTKYTMRELADKINRTKPTVTVLVDKLVELGYVIKEKSVEDSRVTFISLTEKGAALQPVYVAVSDKLNVAVYQNLSEEEAELVEKLLDKINQNLS